ncbi:MAG: glucuronate isomerase [Oscillospiraceae bacterium]
MKSFMDTDFLLTTPTAKTLFHEYAKNQPIVDYHCHINPEEIYTNRAFTNITQMWLEGDHYKWRLMRSDGIDEKYITGNATDKEKFLAFAKALPRAIGNPMYHWCHLELRNYFDYKGELNETTAEEVWTLCEEKLKSPDMTVRGLIKKSNVAFIGTTDDPTDTLEWHEKIKANPIEGLTVAPSFRPDKLVNIDKPIWISSIEKLTAVCGFTVKDIDSLEKAILARMERFNSLGCRAADHGMDYVCYLPCSREEANSIMKKALCGKALTISEVEMYKSYVTVFAARQYLGLGWAMQIHYNCTRSPNSEMFAKLGADTGFDCINTVNCGNALVHLLDTLYFEKLLPRTVIYSLNGTENAFIDTVIGSFQGTEARGKIQHGSAWWFNDTKQGMINQLTSLADLSILGNFIGMLTDSRSFLSYARHEYFRRILCELIGNWIENGEYPADLQRAGALVSDICFGNAKRYFNV